MADPLAYGAESKVLGLKELERKLTAMGSKLAGRALSQAARFAVKPVFTEAKITAPVGEDAHRTFKGNLVSPGYTQRSVKIKTKVRGTTVVASVGVLSEAFYALQFVELGTSRISAEEWLRPAFLRNRQLIENRFADRLKKRIEALTK